MKMEMPEYVYWMPTNEPGFVFPDEYQFQAATVIKAEGQKQKNKNVLNT